MSEATPRRRPTINDVAHESGVSRGTVSRVLNGGHWVSADARASVERAIRKTGFRANPHARNLATSRANSIAFLLTESHDQLFEDPNFSVLMRSAATALAARDLPLVLIMAGSEAEQRRAADFIAAGHVDGVLVVSSHRGVRDFFGELIAGQVPVIACGVPLGHERRIGFVTVNDVESARDMMRHLRGLGRGCIATITGPQDTSGGRSRLEGYRLEQGDDFDPSLVEHGDYSWGSGERAMRALLERHPDIDAVFAANDRMAAAAVQVLQASGRRVPDDVAVGGFDDSPIATQTDPPLTTMRQPFDRIAEEMVRMLLDVIDGKAAARLTLPTELILRESTC